MNILFLHQSFPGQFKHLAPALSGNRAHKVVALGMNPHPVSIPGIAYVGCRPARGNTPNIHPWVGDFESKVIRGQAVLEKAIELRDRHGFNPDVVFSHPGWGESLFLREVWPRARQLIYCEWYYRPHGTDTEFDPEFGTPGEAARARIRAKNAHNLLAMEGADAGLAPTAWQRDTYPDWFRDRIDVIHDGINVPALRKPAAIPRLQLSCPADEEARLPSRTVSLGTDDEILTFVNRNLEPYRGYHVFMRALPEILRRRPKLKVVIVGGNGTSYGARPTAGSWKRKFLDEVRDDIDMSRVHFCGNLRYPDFVRLLQISTVHTYLTYPFVLGWSLLEAMACGCAIVASDTRPVREAIVDGETGRLVGFFDRAALIERICELLDDPAQRLRLGNAATELVMERYDLHTRCLPRQIELVESLGLRHTA